MVPGHQFPVYLTLTKSCIYARNHTFRTPPFLEKTTSQKNKRVYQKLQKGLKSILLLREFAKGKNHQQKQKFTKATKNVSDQYFLRWNLERKKQLQYNIQL